MTSSPYWRPYGPMLGNLRVELGGSARTAMVTTGKVLIPLAIGTGVLAGGAYLLRKPLGIEGSRIPWGALLGGISTASFMSAGLLPRHLRFLAYIASAGSALGSLLVFFSKKDEPVGPLPERVPSGMEVPQAPQEWLNQEFVAQMDARQEQTGGLLRSMFINQPYSVGILNQTNKVFSLFVGLAVRDAQGNIVFRSPAAAIATGRKQMTLNPGQASAETLVAGPVNFWLPQKVYVETELFRRRDDAEPFLVSVPLEVKMTFPVYAGVA